jgi:threonine dehydrogenase-like Zn-dependent dehydrogenase
MAHVRFVAPEYQADGSIRLVRYAYAEHGAGHGWDVLRDDRVHVQVGDGYRCLRVSHCGVCSTDLARRHLPFPLPQVTGHEIVALDAAGVPVAVEINASHAARALAPSRWCECCRAGLATHCPERRVLGIHDLPGGFAPWILVPVGSVHEIPRDISPLTATLIEPFAAALHAVETIAPRDGWTVAVMGPRRLGTLVIAALDAWRRRMGRRCAIVAVTRRPEMAELARAVGADDTMELEAAGRTHDLAQVVVDTTGNPAALSVAIQLATEEVHVKSTTGQTTLGLSHMTELVVDEIALVRWRDVDGVSAHGQRPSPSTAVVLGDVGGDVQRELGRRGARIVAGDDPRAVAEGLARDTTIPLGAADLAVVTSRAGIDAVIRPIAASERGLVRPRGLVAVADIGQPRDALLSALLDKGLRVTTSRCGDLGAAIDLLADPAAGLAHGLGERMVTDLVPALRLEDAFARSAGHRSVKVVATHAAGLL